MKRCETGSKFSALQILFEISSSSGTSTSTMRPVSMQTTWPLGSRPMDRR